MRMCIFIKIAFVLADCKLFKTNVSTTLMCLLRFEYICPICIYSIVTVRRFSFGALEAGKMERHSPFFRIIVGSCRVDGSSTFRATIA